MRLTFVRANIVIRSVRKRRVDRSPCTTASHRRGSSGCSGASGSTPTSSVCPAGTPRSGIGGACATPAQGCAPPPQVAANPAKTTLFAGFTLGRARCPDPASIKKGIGYAWQMRQIDRLSRKEAFLSSQATATMSPAQAAGRTTFSILAANSFSHKLNHKMQSMLPALNPMLKSSYALSFGQIGLLTFTYQITASLLQPLIGMFTDRSPRPYSLSVGMGFTLVGLLLLAFAGNFWLLMLAAALVGTGSSVFHPESSRVARMASGGRHGLAQSVFQVGGNEGSAVGPLLAAFIVLPRGQSSVAWFSCAALLGMFVLFNVGLWYKLHGLARLKPRGAAGAAGKAGPGPRSKEVRVVIGVLLALFFSNYF